MAIIAAIGSLLIEIVKIIVNKTAAQNNATQNYKKPTTADITNGTVKKEYRRQGIARRMLSELMREGRDEGIGRFTLEVRASNEAAIALYRGLGFYQEGVRKNYYESPREDALILWTRERKRTEYD